MSNIVAFVTIAAILVVTPGSDTMLVVRSVIAHGKRAGLLTVAGIAVGCAVHATLSAAGLSAILAASSRAYNVLKIAGAAYLVGLGLHGFWVAAKSPRMAVLDGDDNTTESSGRRRSFRDGLVTNILNPKVAIFYLAFVPQFIDSAAGVVASYSVLAGIHILIGAVWLSALTFVLDWIGSWLNSPAVRRGLEAVTSTALVGLGVRLAVAPP